MLFRSVADEVYVISKIAFNTLKRLQMIPFIPTGLVFNFYEKSKSSKRIEQEILGQFPRLKFSKIPIDSKAFTIALERKSALLEVASNSPARKSIATLA